MFLLINIFLLVASTFYSPGGQHTQYLEIKPTQLTASQIPAIVE